MILGIYALRTILIFHGVPFWSNIHISNPWPIMKCPNFHGINFRHITHGTKSSALLFIESYKKSENPHSLNHSDPMTPSLFFGFNIAFISILFFYFSPPQVSYLVCFQPQMYTKITITKNEKCTQILFQFFFSCVWSLGRSSTICINLVGKWDPSQDTLTKI